MMQTIELEAHTNADGVLKLEVPVGVADSDVDVVIVVQPKMVSAEDHGWPPGYFEQIYDSLASDPLFMRHPQGEYETRESLE